MSGKKSRDKGYRGERNLVKLLNEAGIEARRIPLSGATWMKGDLVIVNMKAEVKVRKEGFKRIYDWLSGNDLLFLKADRKDYLVVMRLDLFEKILKGGVKSE